MVKYIYYSIFLHCLFIALIYFNFHFESITEIETREVSISLLELPSIQKTNPIEEVVEAIEEEEPVLEEESEEEIEELPEPKEEPEEKKEIPKEEVKEEPKKEIEEKPKEEVKKEEPKKEELKQEVKKEEPKKKEPKQEEVKKEEPKKEKPKEEETKQEEPEKEKPKEEPKKEEKEPEKPTEKEPKQEVIKSDEEIDDSINNLETINLSLREKYNVQSQLRRCYRRAMIESKTKENKIRVILVAQISRDGFINTNLDSLIDKTRYESDTIYKTTINNVSRALDLCNPLRNLPIDKYEVWKKVLLEFGEEIFKQDDSKKPVFHLKQKT